MQEREGTLCIVHKWEGFLEKIKKILLELFLSFHTFVDGVLADCFGLCWQGGVNSLSKRKFEDNFKLPQAAVDSSLHLEIYN